MNLRIVAHRLHRIDRGHHTLRAVVIQRRIAHVRTGIAPGNREHRSSLPYQPADQRIVRRKIKDIVFHDPGGHDQDRFGRDGGRCRRILNQFDQCVAEDDFARGGGEVLPDDETPLGPAVCRGLFMQ